MAQGLTDDLFLVAFTVWLSGLWVCRRDLPFLVALIVTSIRVSIPVVYFAGFY
jgi:ABC-type polysaccharide/polyol phosphate export permease